MCRDCEQIFKKKSSYLKHMDVSPCQTHKIKCMVNGCQEKFKTQNQLAYHLTFAHEDLVPWKCPFCPMKYARPDVLKRHVAEQHQGLKRKAEVDFKCPCGYSSDRKVNLDRHVKVCPAHRTGAATFLARAFENSTAVQPVDKALDALNKTFDAVRQAMAKHQAWA